MKKMVTKKGHGLGYKPQPKDHRDYRYEHHVSQTAAALKPTDLTNLVSTVKDQGSLGSCVAHGTTSGFEACQMKAAGSATLGCRLLVYRDGRILGGDFPGDNGCNIRDGIQATVQDGVAPETDWGYDISQFDNTPPAKAVSDAVKDKTINYYLLDGTSDAQKIANIDNCLCVTGLPVVYGMPVYEQYEEVGSNGIIDMPSGDSIGGHCNALFGVTGFTSSDYYITLNSWGQGWGKGYGKFSGGFGLIPRNYIQQYASDSWVIASESQITPTPTPTPPTPVAADGTNPASVYLNGVKYSFVQGAAGALWYIADGGKWAALGGALTSGVAATTVGSDIYIFGRGADKQSTYYRTLTKAWKSIGGIATSAPSATNNGTTLLVSVRGADKALWYRTLDIPTGVWSAWTSLGGEIK